MGNEKIYGPAFPCPCGRGHVRYTRIEHDSFPSSGWDDVELDCIACSGIYAIKRVGYRDWYCVPVSEAGKAGASAIKVPEPGR
jgi:hypothetical protein